MADRAPQERIRSITIPPVGLEGLLGLPKAARGIVLFAHGSGSGRFSPRNNFVAQALREASLATLQIGLCTAHEAATRSNSNEARMASRSACAKPALPHC